MVRELVGLLSPNWGRMPVSWHPLQRSNYDPEAVAARWEAQPCHSQTVVCGSKVPQLRDTLEDGISPFNGEIDYVKFNKYESPIMEMALLSILKKMQW